MHLVAYRCNGEDYCRGCIMGRSDSNFEIHENIDEEECIRLIADYFFKNFLSEDYIEVCGYEIYLILGEKVVWFYYDCTIDNSDDSGYSNNILEKAKASFEKMKKERIQKDKLKEQLEREEEMDAIKKEELEELKRLKKKYD